MSENKNNLKSFLKDSYSSETIEQAGKGFKKMAKNSRKCAKCGSTKNDIRGKLCDKCMSKKEK